MLTYTWERRVRSEEPDFVPCLSEIGEQTFSRDNLIPDLYRGIRLAGQIDVHPGTKTDEPEAFSPANLVA